MKTVKEIKEDDVIPLSVRITEPGEYTISFSNTGEFRYAGSLKLWDKLNNVTVPVLEGNSYTFSIASPVTLSDRFALILGDKDALETEIASVCPNPATDWITINAYSKAPAHVSVLNSFGLPLTKSRTAIQENGANQCNISVSDFAKGVYLILIETEKGKVTKKVIKY